MFDIVPTLDCAGRALKLDRTRVMGIVNVTPDSFSDGGDHASTDAAVAHALKLAAEGADLLDVGGESTRPGAQEVPLEEELRRVVPVIERLARQTGLPISVDTCKPEVMRAAVQAGAGMINDVCALRREGALETAAALGVPVVLMHMPAEPRSMQDDPRYDDVVAQVHRFLAERIFAAELGVPLLAGLSRKRSIGELTGHQAPAERAAGSVAAHLLAAQRGARIVRVHDVAATVDALKVWEAVAAVPAPRRDAAPAIRWPDDD